MMGKEKEPENVPLVEVNIGLLADQVGVTATDTLDLGQGVHNLLLAVNIGVEQTQDVLEVRLLAGHERCRSENHSQPFFLHSIVFPTMPSFHYHHPLPSPVDNSHTKLQPVSFIGEKWRNDKTPGILQIKSSSGSGVERTHDGRLARRDRG